MNIRQEQPADYDEVYELVKKSFATSTNEGEWDYLNEVRKKDTFIPELSLVAENDDGKLIGQIVLYKTIITALDKVYTECKQSSKMQSFSPQSAEFVSCSVKLFGVS